MNIIDMSDKDILELTTFGISEIRSVFDIKHFDFENLTIEMSTENVECPSKEDFMNIYKKYCIIKSNNNDFDLIEFINKTIERTSKQTYSNLEKEFSRNIKKSTDKFYDYSDKVEEDVSRFSKSVDSLTKNIEQRMFEIEKSNNKLISNIDALDIKKIEKSIEDVQKITKVFKSILD
jgi:methyl-accepting chemotaxis protein